MRRLLPFFCLIIVLVVTFLVYQRGLSGPFLFDDNVNITDNDYLKINTLTPDSLRAAAISLLPGIAGRPISMVSFALDYYFQGSEPYGFKLTNLIIHLLNGVCVFVLTTLVLSVYRRRHANEFSQERLHWVALAVASVWLLHPLNLTPVLYVVQRMTSLSAQFTLLGLSAYLYGRLLQLDDQAGWGWILSAFFLFTPLAVLCKENGALLPMFMLLAEGILLNFQAPESRTRLALRVLFVTTVILPTIVLIVYSIYKPAWLLVGYSIRDFTLPERLMTEARVLWFYLRMIVVPDISQLGLYHDDIAISRGLLTPYSTLLACTGMALLAGVAFLLRKRHPIAAFGILFFLLGQSIESSVIALEIVHEHRNYLPSYGILLVIFYYLLSPAWHKGTLGLRQVLAVMLIVFFGAITTIRAGQWANQFDLTLIEVKHHPDSIRANSDVAYMYALLLPAFSPQQAEDHYQLALSHYQKAADLSSGDTAGLLGLIGLNAERGRPVEDRWVQELEYRLEHQPIAAAAVNSLMHLERCLTSGHCKQPPQFLARLLQAALRNPTLSGMRRSNVQFAWSKLLSESMHDRDAALAAAYKAIEAAPEDSEVRITFIKFLLNLDKPDDATKQIAQMRQRDDMNIFRRQLDELEKLATMRIQKNLIKNKNG